MKDDEEKNRIKGQLRGYLEAKGINTRKPFRCLNPEHQDHHPSMSYDSRRKKVHCFSCKADYDMFNLIGIEYGLTDQREIFKKAYEYFGMREEEQRKTQPPPPPPLEEEEEDYTDYLEQARAYIGQTTYPQQRGLSEEVVARFGLGYDPHYLIPKWKALIIPTSNSSYVIRNTDPDAGESDRYRKRGSIHLFNAQALDSAEAPVFVVEGELDALSIMTAGGEAIALGGLNIPQLLNLLRGKNLKQPLIVALDNDEAGKKATKDLEKGFLELKIPYYTRNPYSSYKDANETLLKTGKEAFMAEIETIIDEVKREKNTERGAYKQTSAAHYVDGLFDAVSSWEYIKTGFKRLDDALGDGHCNVGLHEGLYVIGAISSLGKTTFALQVADQIAQGGQDVLIFSLEMSRNELIAKSLSRITYIEELLEGKDIKSINLNAQTTRALMSFTRRSSFTPYELAVINSAKGSYLKYAMNVYIIEGSSELGVAQIREATEKHIYLTGRKPVVIVDYLQILAPCDVRATDKQNVDRIVTELKRISRDYSVSVIGISSFNRMNYRAKVKMESFKESGSLEYSCDVMIGLQLEGVEEDNFDVTEAKKSDPRKVELVILKNRNGRTGELVKYDYFPMFNYFEESKEETMAAFGRR